MFSVKLKSILCECYCYYLCGHQHLNNGLDKTFLVDETSALASYWSTHPIPAL